MKYILALALLPASPAAAEVVSADAHDFEVRLAPQQAGNGFAKQRVIVNQQDSSQRSTVTSSSPDSLPMLEAPR